MERGYEWLLLAMHGAGACLLLRGAARRLTRWFFAAQAAVFPLGLAFLWAPPLLLMAPFAGADCRESYIDVPFTLGMGFQAHSFWVLFSLIIVLTLRPRLKLSALWHAMRRPAHAAG